LANSDYSGIVRIPFLLTPPKEYQIYGAFWWLDRSSSLLYGGIIADSKTLAAIDMIVVRHLFMCCMYEVQKEREHPQKPNP